MTPNGLFYQLLVVALVLLCLLLHVWCPDSRSPVSQMPLKPAKPRRKRAKAPKPFTGYIHKPLCEACEQGLDTRPKAPGAPPPMIIFTRGRRRTVDASGQFCPDHDCSYHGWLGRGNIRANGPPGGQRWRQLQCVSCQGYVYETHRTPAGSPGYFNSTGRNSWGITGGVFVILAFRVKWRWHTTPTISVTTGA